jgi:hypothetical protein
VTSLVTRFSFDVGWALRWALSSLYLIAVVILRESRRNWRAATWLMRHLAERTAAEDEAQSTE